jgi:hypothetical protein
MAGKNESFIDKPGGFILFSFALLLGRIPLWLLLLLVYTRAPHMNIRAFVAFSVAIIFAKGILYAYEKDKSIARGSFVSLWQHIVKPLVLSFVIYIGVIGVMLAFPDGAKSAQVMCLMALAIVIGLVAVNFFRKKSAVKAPELILERDAALHLTLTLLWLYVFFSPDGSLFSAIAILMIYSMEFISTYLNKSSIA